MQMVRDELGKGAVGVLEEMVKRLEHGDDLGAIDAKVIEATVAGPTAASASFLLCTLRSSVP